MKKKLIRRQNALIKGKERSTRFFIGFLIALLSFVNVFTALPFNTFAEEPQDPPAEEVVEETPPAEEPAPDPVEEARAAAEAEALARLEAEKQALLNQLATQQQAIEDGLAEEHPDQFPPEEEPQDPPVEEVVEGDTPTEEPAQEEETTSEEATSEDPGTEEDTTNSEETTGDSQNESTEETSGTTEATSGGNSSGTGEETPLEEVFEGDQEETATSTPTTTGGVIYDDHIDTGDADSAVDVDNVMNNTSADISGMEGGCDTTCDNNATSTGEVIGNDDDGDFSESDVSVSEETDVDIHNDNDADISNNLDGEADSGNNSLDAGEGDSVVYESSIDTGNSQAVAGLSNTANTNSVYTGGSSGTDYPHMRTTVINEDTGDASVNTSEKDVKKSYSVINENDADIKNKIDLLANSGQNFITGGTVGKSSINTGNSAALANVVNFANFNWFNSEAIPYILNSGSTSEDINLWNQLVNSYGLDTVKKFFVGNKNTGDLSYNSSTLNYEEDLTIKNDNNAKIVNDIELNVLSGLNGMMGNQLLNSSIETGDTNAVVSLINFLNGNFLNANLVFSVVNIFGDYSGNLILPGEGQLFGSGAGCCSDTSIVNDISGDGSINEALVIVNEETDIDLVNTVSEENNIDVNAITGENTMNGGHLLDSSTETGDATALQNIVSLNNQNVIGGTWFLGLFNFFGEWYGSFYNAPEGARVSGNSNSFVVSADGNGLPAECNDCNTDEFVVANEATGDFSENYSTLKVTKRTDVENINDALIENNITVNTVSGQNEFDYGFAAKGLETKTGDSKVASNVVNLSNLNFMNTNVVLTIFNVFGDFFGDVVMGTTDYSLGYLGDRSEASSGDTITYTIDVSNNGDGRGAGATVTATYDSSQVTVIDTGGGTDNGVGTITWELGEVPAGSYGTLTFVVEVNSDAGGDTISSTAVIDDPSDTNQSDNSAVFTVSLTSSDGTGSGLVNGEGGGNGSGGGDNGSGGSNGSSGNGSGGGGGSGGVGGITYGGQPELQLQKRVRDGEGPYYPGDIVYFSVALKNAGNGAAFDVKLYDQLTNELGDSAYENTWDIGLIYKGETIVVDYTIQVPEGVTAGSYTNSSLADGFDDFHNLVTSNESNVTVIFEGTAPLPDSGDSSESNEEVDGSGGSDEEEATIVSEESGSEEGGGETDNNNTIVAGTRSGIVNSASADELDDDELAIAGFEEFGEVEGSKATNEGTTQLISWSSLGLLVLLLLLFFVILFAWRRRRESDEIDSIHYS